MRRTSASFATAALVLGIVAAPAGAGSTDYLLELGGVDGESQDDKHKNQIEILSYSWGATQTSTGFGHGGGGGTGKVNVHDISISKMPATATAKGEKGGTEDINIGVGELQESGEAEITLKGSAAKRLPGKRTPPTVTLKRGSSAAAASGGVQVAAGDVDGDGRADAVSPRDAASGLATGKRMHKPVTFQTPRETGSLTIQGKFPGCVVGARYPVMKLGNAAKRYTLQDAIITSCRTVASGGDALPMEEVSFNYAKIES